MTDVRHDLQYPMSEADVNRLNAMIMSMWRKLHGDINFSDISSDIKTQLYTNWLQPQGEGNLDSSKPFTVRFYVPENTKKIKKANINIITSRYRLDSDVTSSVPSFSSASSITSGSSSSLTTNASSKDSAFVQMWGEHGDFPPATTPTHSDNDVTDMEPYQNYPGSYLVQTLQSGHTRAVAKAPLAYHPKANPPGSGELYAWVDMWKIQHKHDIQHAHGMNHTHNISLGFEIPGHNHTLRMGIIEANNDPVNVRTYINNNLVGNVLNGSGTVENNLDISEHVIIGGWNEIVVTSENVARITIYGIIELLQRY